MFQWIGFIDLSFGVAVELSVRLVVAWSAWCTLGFTGPGCLGSRCFCRRGLCSSCRSFVAWNRRGFSFDSGWVGFGQWLNLFVLFAWSSLVFEPRGPYSFSRCYFHSLAGLLALFWLPSGSRGSSLGWFCSCWSYHRLISRTCCYSCFSFSSLSMIFRCSYPFLISNVSLSTI